MSEEAPQAHAGLDDALSYLDAVKVQFAGNMDTYNEFLNLMTEYRNQTIDISGVIDRVVALFRGHNGLIQGYNAFLPQGYRIDILGEDIRVTTPEGTTIH